MHIAFLTPEYPHPKVAKSAGIGTSIKNLAQALIQETYKEHKCKVSIIVYGQKEKAILEDNGVEIHLIKFKKYPVGGFYRYRKYINKKVNKLVKRKSIDVLEASDWTGVTALMKFSIPVVIRLHGSDTYFCNLESRKQKKKNYYFEKKALVAADAITSVSAFTATKTKEIFGLDKEISVIHNLIDTSLFEPLKSTAAHNRILYFGSVIRKKGVLALAKSFNKVLSTIPDAQLVFLGKDVIDYKEQKSTIALIKDLVATEAHNNLSFISNVPYKEVQQHISDAAVVCLPSYAEAFPMTWLEAMAMEKPMATSNIGWAPEIMEHGKTGLTVHPDDTEALAKALCTLLENKDLREQYGKAARKRLLSDFNAKKIVNQNITFYEKIIAG